MNDTTDVTEAEFEALADLLAEKRDEWPRLVNDMASEDLADEIFKAGYRKPRIISTVEELNALPVRSVIREAHGYIMEKLSDGWYTPAIESKYRGVNTFVPAMVLYVPVPPEGGETK